MSDFSDSFMAVLFGMAIADQQSYKRIEPSEYDDRELVPQIDPSLPADEYQKALTEWLVTKKKPEDYPLKKDCNQSYQKIEPPEYDDRELAPQLDPNLPVHERYMQLIHTLAHRKTPEDYPLKKDCKKR